jgi:hypothetical protein
MGDALGLDEGNRYSIVAMIVSLIFSHSIHERIANSIHPVLRRLCNCRPPVNSNYEEDRSLDNGSLRLPVRSEDDYESLY